MGWAGTLSVILPMLMQSCQNGASIAKYDPVSTIIIGRKKGQHARHYQSNSWQLYKDFPKETHWLICVY
jgi:hypothetical protein